MSILLTVLATRDNRILTLESENAELRLKAKQLEKELAVHENYNNSTRDARLYAKKRRQYHDDAANAQSGEGSPEKTGESVTGADGGTGEGTPSEHSGKTEESVTGADVTAQGMAGKTDDKTDGKQAPAAKPKRRGHKLRTPGKSHGNKPTFEKRFTPYLCGKCGRTDLQPFERHSKTVIDNTECDKEICYTEVNTSVVCVGCGAVTHPDTDTIPGTSCGPRLRRIIANMHEVIPSVRGIKRLLYTNHNRTLSTGAISNCLAAMVKHAEEGNGPEMPESCSVALGGGLPIPWSGTIQDTDVTWSGQYIPPLMVWLEEKASMAPYAEFDESHANVAGEYAQALVLKAGMVVIIHIEPDRSKETIRRLFWMVLCRPLLVDMYRGGNAFVDAFQACLIHIARWLESLAVKHGVGSPEHILYVMFDRIRADSKAAGKVTTRMAGGPLESACDITRALLNPRIREYADAQKSKLERRVEAICEWFRTGEVSDEENRRMADSLLRALPFMFTSIDYPGMANNTNGVERIIRHDHVRPRSTQRLLPDWAAAKNAGILRSIYATCRLNGCIPGDILGRKRGSDPFSAGIPPSIFHPPGRAGEREVAGRTGSPLALIEKIDNAK